jgi:hypothetical protein
MERIKLMSDEELKKEAESCEDLVFSAYKSDPVTYRNFTGFTRWDMHEAFKKGFELCERRATEKLKEVAEHFFYICSPYKKGELENMFNFQFQRFLKEQQNQEAIDLLKEWKERDGSEIEENYNLLKKEQADGE